MRRIHLGGEIGIVLQPGLFQQQRIELRFQAADADPLTVGAFIRVIHVGAGIEQVHAALVLPDAVGAETPDHRHQRGGTIGHGAIDHLALAGGLGVQQRGYHAERQHHAAAAEIADHVDRRRRLLARPAIGVQGAGQRDIVDVVAGGVGIGPELAPAGHAAIYQLGIDGVAFCRAQAQPLGHAGAETFEKRIGGFHQIQHQRPAFVTLQIHPDHPSAAQQRITRIDPRARPIHPDHFRAMIGQHHTGKWPRPDPGQFDDPDSLQRPGHMRHSLVFGPQVARRARQAKLLGVAGAGTAAGGLQSVRGTNGKVCRSTISLTARWASSNAASVCGLAAASALAMATRP